MKKVIFWDFDGTLVKPNQSFLESLVRAAEELRLSLPWKTLGDFLNSACSWNRPEEIYPEATGEAWWETLLARLNKFSTENTVPVEKISEFQKRFRLYAVSYHYELYDDALETLEKVNDLGYDNYILSNNFPELKDTIQALGISPYLKGVILSSCLGAEKPNCLLFQKALELAGCPETAIMIGDNPKADMEGAKAQGLSTILVHKGVPCPAADQRAAELKVIPELLKELG